VFPRSALRPLLRWTSLALLLAVLARLGVARLHLQNFPLFVIVVVALSLVTVAVFMATADRKPEE
jgi:hypothetical protein